MGGGSNPGWKQFQRTVCRFFGGECAKRYAQGSDCVDTPWAIEVKKLNNPYPRGVDFAQAARQSAEEKKPWILVTKANNQKFDTAIVSMRMSTLKQFLEERER